MIWNVKNTPLPPPDSDGPYRYFMIGGVTPVRVICDPRGNFVGAETADTTRDGALRFANTLLGTIMKDELDVEECSKQDFVAMCRRTWGGE